MFASIIYTPSCFMNLFAFLYHLSAFSFQISFFYFRVIWFRFRKQPEKDLENLQNCQVRTRQTGNYPPLGMCNLINSNKHIDQADQCTNRGLNLWHHNNSGEILHIFCLLQFFYIYLEQKNSEFNILNVLSKLLRSLTSKFFLQQFEKKNYNIYQICYCVSPL